MTGLEERIRHSLHFLGALSTFEKVAMILLIGFGSYLRFDGIGDWMVGGDDGLHMYYAIHPTAWQSFIFVSEREMHPALSYLILYFLSQYVSSAPEVLRLVGEVPGFLLMPGMYALGRVLIGRRAGLFLLGMAALSPMLIIQSENFRSYAMCQCFLLAGMISAYYYLQQGQVRWRRYYYGWMALALFSEYASAMPVLATGGVMLYRVWGRAARKVTPEFVRLMVGHLLLALFWGGQLFYYFHSGGRGQEAMGHVVSGFVYAPLQIVSRLYEVMGGFLAVPGNPAYWVLVAMVAGGLAFMLHRRERFLAPLVLVALGVALTASVFRLYPMMATRHGLWIMLFTCLPPAYLVEHMGRFYGTRRGMAPAIWCVLGVLILSNGIFLGASYFKPETYRLPHDAMKTELVATMQDFTGALAFLAKQRAEAWLLLNPADEMRIEYLTRYHPVFPPLPLHQLVCMGWHIEKVYQIDRCIHWAFPQSLNYDPTLYKRMQALKQVAEGGDAYILTNPIPELLTRYDIIDPAKPAYISPTVMVVPFSQRRRQMLSDDAAALLVQLDKRRAAWH
jgi:hypothetical protein